MEGSVGRSFFDEIRRSVKISYFIASVIPLGLLVYFSIEYVYPYVAKGNLSELPLDIGIILILAVFMSLLGLFMSTKATNTSLASLQELYSKLNSLVEVTKQFRETLYLDVLLESIVRSAMQLNSAKAGSLLLYDDMGNLTFKVILGERAQAVKHRVVKRGEGVSGWVAETGQSAIINDVTKDSRYNPDFDRESGFKTCSIICVPLIHNAEVIGAIEILNKTTGDFTKEDEKLLYSLADQAAISIAQSRLYESRHSDIIQITEIIVGAQDYHSPEKKGHARRVAKYANLIGREMGLSDQELKNIYYGCLFHDVGLLKIDIADHQKKEKYIFHPQLGYDMIRPISLWSEAAELVLNHHERYDGTGYPAGKKGGEIPLGARILSVANVFDVITSVHSYRKQFDYDSAIKEIEANSGSQFDPTVVKAFKTSIKNTDIV